MAGPEKVEHAWPPSGEHFWSKWQHQTGLPIPTQYRICIHPDCSATELRDTPMA